MYIYRGKVHVWNVDVGQLEYTWTRRYKYLTSLKSHQPFGLRWFRVPYPTIPIPFGRDLSLPHTPSQGSGPMVSRVVWNLFRGPKNVKNPKTFDHFGATPKSAPLSLVQLFCSKPPRLSTKMAHGCVAKQDAFPMLLGLAPPPSDKKLQKPLCFFSFFRAYQPKPSRLCTNIARHAKPQKLYTFWRFCGVAKTTKTDGFCHPPGQQ